MIELTCLAWGVEKKGVYVERKKEREGGEGCVLCLSLTRVTDSYGVIFPLFVYILRQAQNQDRRTNPESDRRWRRKFPPKYLIPFLSIARPVFLKRARVFCHIFPLFFSFSLFLFVKSQMLYNEHIFMLVINFVRPFI